MLPCPFPIRYPYWKVKQRAAERGRAEESDCKLIWWQIPLLSPVALAADAGGRGGRRLLSSASKVALRRGGGLSPSLEGVWETTGPYKPWFFFASVRMLLHSSQGRVFGFLRGKWDRTNLREGMCSVEDLRRNSPCAWELLESRFQKNSPPFSSCLGEVH